MSYATEWINKTVGIDTKDVIVPLSVCNNEKLRFDGKNCFVRNQMSSGQILHYSCKASLKVKTTSNNPINFVNFLQ